ncbi:MAG: class I SAM-dependent methyltransferase [Hyphomicrobiales bacterium]
MLGAVAGRIMAKRPSNRDRNLWTVELLQLQPHHRVLEIGCGPGLALEACASKLSEGCAVGVDHSATMIGQANARLREAVKRGRVELRLEGLELLEQLERKPFDRIFSVNVVQFLPDKTAAFRSILAALASGGVAATTYQPRNQAPTREDALRMAREISRTMNEAGFVDMRIEELPIKPVPAVCVLGRRPK